MIKMITFIQDLRGPAMSDQEWGKYQKETKAHALKISPIFNAVWLDIDQVNTRYTHVDFG